jgi:hypothetical protein
MDNLDLTRRVSLLAGNGALLLFFATQGMGPTQSFDATFEMWNAGRLAAAPLAGMIFAFWTLIYPKAKIATLLEALSGGCFLVWPLIWTLSTYVVPQAYQ